MVRYILDAHKVGIQSVVFTGGEPMLYYSNLLAPMALASKLGMYIDLRSNGYWAISYEKAYTILKLLQGIGLNRLGLSTDKYHNCNHNQSKSKMSHTIRDATRASRALGIETYMDWIGNETREEVEEYLGVDGDSTLRMVGQPLKVGKARQLTNGAFARIPIEEVEHCSEYSKSCGNSGDDDNPLLTVFPGGYVSLHPCCWVNPSLIAKKPRGKDWIRELTVETVLNPAVDFLYNNGIGGLISKAREQYPNLLKEYYSHQCEACYDLLGVLFRNSNSNGRLPHYLEELKH